MILAKAPISESSWMIADWLEFQVLCSEFSSCSLRNVLRMSDEDQDAENADIGEQDSINERCVEKAVSEIQVRTTSLKTAYPFEITEDGNELVIKESLGAGAYTYIYCLLFSHVNREDVLIPDPPHAPKDRDLLQICATIAAAGYIYGNATSFGFPRANGDGFLTALTAVYEKIKDGVVVANIPAGLPSAVKDGGIDVIAWQDTPDGGAGGLYMLGQVASGSNWQDKSVKPDIGLFHVYWFVRQPASTPLPAMFIPFCLDVRENETLDDVSYYKTHKYGELFYRYKLPLSVDNGLTLEAIIENSQSIERVDDFNDVIEYVDRFRQNVLMAYSGVI